MENKEETDRGEGIEDILIKQKAVKVQLAGNAENFKHVEREMKEGSKTV